MTLDIGFVGTGADPDQQDSDGFAMAYRHASAYQRLEDCQIRTCADIVPENAAAFAQHHDIPEEDAFESYSEMLRAVEPDVVSVCVPPGVHADVVTEIAAMGVPDAIHCEKPMATTWADCQEMVTACDEAGIQLTINHQRRVGPIFRRAKAILEDGAIGSLQRIEWSTKNLFDSGTHLFDLSNYYADDQDVEWILCGVDYREENKWFGTHNENQAIAQWQYADGTYGMATTGTAADALGCYIRLVGEDGTIELGPEDGPPMRIRHGRTLGWSDVDVDENIWGDTRYSLFTGGLTKVSELLPGLPDRPFEDPGHIDRAIEEVVTALREDRRSVLGAHRALDATELIFAAWEGVRRRGRVDLPLDIEDNPLQEMATAGDLAIDLESDANERAAVAPQTD